MVLFFFFLAIEVSNYTLNGIKINYRSALFYICVLLLLHSVPVLPEVSPSSILKTRCLSFLSPVSFPLSPSLSN